MEVLNAPWRMIYIRGEKPDGCIFCKDDFLKEDLILVEGKNVFVMMNRYPYTCGHVMIIPYRHVCSVEDLGPEERLEMFDLMDVSIRVLKETLNPEGFNIGMNLGRAAGAGIEDHLHMHVVPRWLGDTNYINVIGEVRVIPEHVTKTWETLVPCYQRYCRRP